MTPTWTTKSGLLALVLVTGFGLAACGSSGGSVTAVPQSVAPGAGSAPSTADGNVTVDTNFTGEGSEEICRDARELDESGALNGADLTKENFDKVQAALGKMQGNAPGEIKVDLQKVGEAIAALRTIYEKYDFDASRIAGALTSDPEISKAVGTINDPAFQQAAARVDAYFTQVCGLAPPTS